MKEVKKADPAARRQALLLIVFVAVTGALLIQGFDLFLEPFREWLTSEPSEMERRARLAIYVVAIVFSAPVIACAVYLWRLGTRALRAQRFPPPGIRVIRDTPVVEGQGAMNRGRVIQILAVCLGVSAVVLVLFFMWFSQTIGKGAS